MQPIEISPFITWAVFWAVLFLLWFETAPRLMMHVKSRRRR